MFHSGWKAHVGGTHGGEGGGGERRWMMRRRRRRRWWVGGVTAGRCKSGKRILAEEFMCVCVRV